MIRKGYLFSCFPGCGWGTFRLEATTDGAIEAQQMSGEQHLEAAKAALEAMKFPALLPPGWTAHLLRSAVLSCSMGKTCEVVPAPDEGLQTKRDQVREKEVFSDRRQRIGLAGKQTCILGDADHGKDFGEVRR